MFSNNYVSLVLAFLFTRAKNSLSDQFLIIWKAGEVARDATSRCEVISRQEEIKRDKTA